MQITVDMSTIERMAKRYAGSEPIIREEVKTGMTRCVVQIEADAKKKVPTDTHHLQRSLTHEVVQMGNRTVGRAGTNVNYAKVIEEGRKPGGEMPPPGVLLGWMRRRGIEVGTPDPDGNGYFSVEFAIADSIARRGTKAQPYLRPAIDDNRQVIQRELGTAVPQRILKRLAAGS